LAYAASASGISCGLDASVGSVIAIAYLFDCDFARYV